MKLALLLTAMALLVTRDARRTPVNSPPCAATHELTTRALNSLKALVTSSGTLPTQWRTQSNIPSVPESEIVIVADTTICDAAHAAYNVQKGTPNAPRSINVIRVGTIYLVRDVKDVGGEWTQWLAYDSTFSQLRNKVGI